MHNLNADPFLMNAHLECIQKFETQLKDPESPKEKIDLLAELVGEHAATRIAVLSVTRQIVAAQKETEIYCLKAERLAALDDSFQDTLHEVDFSTRRRDGLFVV